MAQLVARLLWADVLSFRVLAGSNISVSPPVIRDWAIKGLGMSSLVYVTGHIKDPVALSEKKRRLSPGGRFPPSFIHQVIIITRMNKLYNHMICSRPEDGLRCRLGVKLPLKLNFAHRTILMDQHLITYCKYHSHWFLITIQKTCCIPQTIRKLVNWLRIGIWCQLFWPILKLKAVGKQNSTDPPIFRKPHDNGLITSDYQWPNLALFLFVRPFSFPSSRLIR